MPSIEHIFWPRLFGDSTNCRYDSKNDDASYNTSVNTLIDWFTSHSRIFHLRGDVTITEEVLQNVRLWAGRDIYPATRAVTWDLGFSGLIWRTAPFSRLLRLTRERGESILTQILTGRQWIQGTITIYLPCNAYVSNSRIPCWVQHGKENALFNYQLVMLVIFETGVGVALLSILYLPFGLWLRLTNFSFAIFTWSYPKNYSIRQYGPEKSESHKLRIFWRQNIKLTIETNFIHMKFSKFVCIWLFC
jgi:hypothetical protein